MSSHHQAHSHYQHRSIVTQPVAGPGPAPTRLAELLDFVKQEFDNVLSDAQHAKAQTTEFEGHVNNHIDELGQLREQYFALESEHRQLKASYEDEITRLRQEVADLRSNGPSATLDQRSHPPQAPPPPVGQGSANLFGGIVNPAAGPPGPSTRAVDHVLTGSTRDREAAFGNGTVGGARVDAVDHPIKRSRQDRDRDEDPRANGREGNGASSPGVLSRGDMRSKPRVAEGFGKPTRVSGPHALPPGPISTAPQPVPSGQPGPPTPSTNANVLLDLDPESLPSGLKKEGTDWMTVFNPKARKALDVGLVHTLVHDSVVCCVTFSPDGMILATGCNRSTTLYNTRTGAKICSLVDEASGNKADNYIRSACFSPDGKLLATGSEDRTVRIWDINKRIVERTLSGHKSEIYCLAFSPDGRLLVSGSGDKTARIWDIYEGVSRYHLLIEDITPTENGPMDAGVTSVCISPDGSLLAAGSLDTVVRLWDTRTGQLLDKLKGHKDSVYSVAFSPDGTFLVSGSLDKTLKMWDLGTLDRTAANAPAKREDGDNGERSDRGFDPSRSSTLCTTTLTGHKDYVLSVAVSPDGAWIVSGSKDRGVQFWDPKTATAQFMLQGHKNSVISIAMSPVGGLLATGSGDWSCRLWNVTAVDE